MTQAEKDICNIIFKEGNLVNIENYTSEGVVIEFFEVEYFGEIYHMTKHDGEWVYFYHC